MWDQRQRRCETLWDRKRSKCVGGRSFILYEVTMKAGRQASTKALMKTRWRSSDHSSQISAGRFLPSKMWARHLTLTMPRILVWAIQELPLPLGGALWRVRYRIRVMLASGIEESMTEAPMPSRKRGKAYVEPHTGPHVELSPLSEIRLFSFCS